MDAGADVRKCHDGMGLRNEHDRMSEAADFLSGLPPRESA